MFVSNYGGVDTQCNQILDNPTMSYLTYRSVRVQYSDSDSKTRALRRSLSTQLILPVFNYINATFLEVLVTECDEKDILVTDRRPFNPHITIMKVSKMVRKGKRGEK